MSQNTIDPSKIFLEPIAKSNTKPEATVVDDQAYWYAPLEKGVRKPTPITFETLRKIARASSVARICINTLKHEITQVPWAIVPRDPKKSKGDPSKIEELTRFFEYPNPNNETFRTFLDKILEDLLVLDAVAIEKTNTVGGKPAAMYYVDAATIRPCFDKHGMQGDPAYVQYVKNNNTATPNAEWSKDEFIYFMQNPQADVKNYGYGLSPLEGVLMTVTNLLNAENYNGTFFEQGSIPAMIVNLGQNVQKDGVEKFKAMWKSEMEGKPWKTAFIGGAEKPEVMNLSETNRDMQFMEYQMLLLKILVAAYEMSPQDIGFTMDINKAVGEVQANLSKSQGFRSVLSLLREYFNQSIVWGWFEYRDLKFDWQDTQPLSGKERVEIADIEARNGFSTINEYRKSVGKEPIPGGDRHYIMTASGPMFLDQMGIGAVNEAGTVGDEPENSGTASEPVDNTVDNVDNSVMVGGTTATDSVQQTALNGAQIASLKDIVSNFAAGLLSKESAFNLIKIAFPEVDMKLVEEMLSGAVSIPVEAIGKSRKVSKTVQLGNYLCWMDDGGDSQPFIYTDFFKQRGFVIKPPVSPDLDAPYIEERLSQEAIAMGLNVPSTTIKTIDELLLMLPEEVAWQFRGYQDVEATYYSAKWERVHGLSRRYAFYIVSEFIPGRNLMQPALLMDMRNNPDSYIDAIKDLARLSVWEKSRMLGERRASHYIITPLKQAFGLDYEIENDPFAWDLNHTAVLDILRKEVPMLADVYLSEIGDAWTTTRTI